VIQVTVRNNPVDVGGVERGGIALAVKLHRSRSTLEAQQFSPLECSKVKLHARLVPSVSGKKVVGGADVNDGIVES
jgi:hypothetical protein